MHFYADFGESLIKNLSLFENVFWGGKKKNLQWRILPLLGGCCIFITLILQPLGTLRTSVFRKTLSPIATAQSCPADSQRWAACVLLLLFSSFFQIYSNKNWSESYLQQKPKKTKITPPQKLFIFILFYIKYKKATWVVYLFIYFVIWSWFRIRNESTYPHRRMKARRGLTDSLLYLTVI